jgi:hypothetical protein
MAEYRSDGEKKYCNWCIGNDAITIEVAYVRMYL